MNEMQLSRLSHYDYLDKNKRLIELPCRIGDEIYVICKCENIPAQLDGSYYDSDGGPGTATGYYCPYGYDCPYDTDSCEEVEDKEEVFKDTVRSFFISEDGIEIVAENCVVSCRLGEGIFFTREEAVKYLKGEESNGEKL